MLRHRHVRACAAGALLAGCLVAAGCGGAGHGPAGTTTLATTSTAPRPGQALSAADRAALAVARRWADTLRRGDPTRAALTFALPARVANGGPPVVLATRAAVAFFDATLPCGAKVATAEPSAHGFLVVSFVLTDRPGGDCGAGAGDVARVAIRVRAGHITDWLRLPNASAGSQVAV